MDLDTARLRVRKLVDDEDEDKFDDDEVDAALASAQGEVWTDALAGGGRRYFRLTATVTSTSAGVLDLSTQKPRQILALSYDGGTGQRLYVEPVRREDAPSDYEVATTLEMLYLPDVTFPALGSDDFVWGSATAMPSVVAQFDSLLVAIAVLDLKPKEAEALKELERRVEEKRAALARALPLSTWSVIPRDALAGGSRRCAPFGYIETGPFALQLVT